MSGVLLLIGLSSKWAASDPFVIETVLKHADVVFGNEGETRCEKTTLETSGEDVNNTLEPSGEEIAIHSNRVEKIQVVCASVTVQGCGSSAPKAPTL